MAPDLRIRVERDAGVPVGTQLAWRLRTLIDEGRLAAGDRLPSIRELAAQAGVNVNTVRAVYGRLEHEGRIRTEHGRGSFVAAPARQDAATRRELRRQIELLESELVRRPQLPADGVQPDRPAASAGGLLSTTELEQVRDGLLARLHELDAARADVIERLNELEAVEAAEAAGGQAAAAPGPRRGSSTSVSGARVRWVGAH